MAGIEACINRPSFPSLLANPFFEVPQKQQSVAIQAYSSKCTILMAKAYDKVVQVGVLVSFLVYLFYGKIQYLISVENIFDFTHQNLYLLYLIILLQHVLSRLLHQLSCCGIFTCCTSYSVVAPFIIFTVLAIILAKPFC